MTFGRVTGENGTGKEMDAGSVIRELKWAYQLGFGPGLLLCAFARSILSCL
jgi:hypothetical protein